MAATRKGTGEPLLPGAAGPDGRPVPAAKKSLGQHFLRRPDICRRIAQLVAPGEDGRILEIGPGPGALTVELEALPHARLLLVEKDEYWARVRETEGDSRTEVRCMDALAFPWEALEGAWSIVGNLPYNVASPLIWDIAGRCRALGKAAFMVQKEVGERLAAQAGSRQYGALSVWVQAWLCVRREFTVGPAAFSPPPKVDSMVLSFLPKGKADLPGNPQALASVIRIAFGQRRKQLGGVLRRQGRTDLLEGMEALGLPPTARAEDLTVGQFLALAGYLRPAARQ